MKKNFVKKLALGLALVMAVTSVPATSEAAAKPGFKSSKVTVKVGQTKKYSTENASKYSVKFKIGNKDVATIKYSAGSKSVKVTGVAEGKTTLRADFKSYATKKTTTVKVPVTVKVAQKIEEIKAVTPKKVSVKFTEALATALTKSNVTVTDANGIKSAIQSVTVSTDKKFVTIDLYSDLVSGTTYTVNVTDGSKTYAADLAFVKGKVAKIVGVNQIVEANGQNQPIVYTVYDENGLDITESTIVTFESNVNVNADGTVNLTDGVLAYVTVVYTDLTTGAQVKSETFTVTGTSAVASTLTAVTIDNGTISGTVANWPKKVVTSIFKDETTDNVLNVLYVDQYGNNKVATNGLTVAYESMDSSVFVVDNKDGKITPVNTGSAQLKVTVGKVTQYFTITVLAPSKATSLVLDSATSVLKASMTNSSENKAKVKFDVKDQYGNKITTGTPANLTFTLASGKGVLVEAPTVGSTVAATAGTALTLTAAKPGTAVFKVTSADNTINYAMVSVTVYAKDNTVVKYALKGVANLDREHNYDGDPTTVLHTTTIDLKPVNKDGFVVAEADNSVVSEALSGAAVTVIIPDGTKVPESTSFTVDTITDVNYQTPGTYNVVATVNGTTVATASFTVSDTGIAPKLTTKKVNVANGTLVSSNFEVATGWTIEKVLFNSGNSNALASSTTDIPLLGTGAFTNATPYNVTLYNVKVVVKNTATNREFTIAIGSPIVVLP